MSRPQRILVTGNSGSGKSTFALALADMLELPVIHLDTLFWRPDKARQTPDALVRLASEAADREQWIFEGFNIETFAARASRAQAIVMLDMPSWLCVLRLLRQRGSRTGTHQSAARLSWRDRLRFLRWVWIFPWDRRPGLMRDIEAFKQGRDVVVLRSPREVRRFLDRVEDGSTWGRGDD